LEALALLTLGLVRPWGERVPSWIPLFGGWRIPPRLVEAVAGTGAVLLALIFAAAFRDFPTLPEVEARGLLLTAAALAAAAGSRHRPLSPPALDPPAGGGRAGPTADRK
jgi:hypothetical protein